MTRPGAPTAGRRRCCGALRCAGRRWLPPASSSAFSAPDVAGSAFDEASWSDASDPGRFAPPVPPPDPLPRPLPPRRRRRLAPVAPVRLLRLLRWHRRSAIRRRPAGSVVRRSVRSRRLRLCCHSTPGCRDPRVAPFDRCEGDRGGPGCIGARSATGFGDTTGSRASRAAERRAYAVHQIRSFRGCVLARRPVPRAARRGRASLDSSMTPHGATSAAAGGHVYGEDSSTRLDRSHPPNASVGHPSHSGCPPQEPHVGRIPHVRGGAHPSRR